MITLVYLGSDTRPPRFSKNPDQKVKEKKGKLECHDLHIPGISGSALDLIPPVVEVPDNFLFTQYILIIFV